MTDTDTTPPTTETGEQLPKRDARIEFVATLALAFGLGALGFGTGLHVSLISVQAAVVETTTLSLEAQVGSDLYRVLLDMQTRANRALYTSAVLLVGGALLSERRHVRNEVQSLIAYLETEDDTEGDADA